MPPGIVLVYSPFSSFEAAAKEVLRHLRAQFGFDAWMVSRTDGEQIQIVQVDDSRYGINPGSSYSWSESICYRMATGLGPNIAPNLAEIPAYSSAPFATRVPVAAYIGFPLWDCDGQLFGTLCALAAEPQSESLKAHSETFRLFGRLLSTILTLDLQAKSKRRQATFTPDLSQLVDSETQLLSCRGWNRYIEQREYRKTPTRGDSYLAKLTLWDNSVACIKQIAEFLRQSLGPDAVLAKSSEGDILICLPDWTAEEGEEKLKRVVGSVAERFNRNCSYSTIDVGLATQCS